MFAIDHETEEMIINPYIRISKSLDLGVCLNTSTFGNCQKKLISHLNDDILKLGKIEGKEFYTVEAIVGEYNCEPNETFLNSVSLVRHERSRTILGYLERGIVESELPKTFASLNKS